MVNRARQEIGGRNEIRVEHGDKFTGGRLEPFLQCAGFVSFAIGAVEILDRMPDVPVFLAKGFGELMAVVGGIVEHLNLQKFARILDLDGFVDQPLQHVALVIKRQLDRDPGQLVETDGRFADRILPVLEIGANGLESMEPVNRQQRKNAEVGDQYRPVEPGKLVDAGESVVEKPAREPVQCGGDQQRRQDGQRIHTGVRFCRTPARNRGTRAFTVFSIVYTAVSLLRVLGGKEEFALSKRESGREARSRHPSRLLLIAGPLPPVAGCAPLFNARL